MKLGIISDVHSNLSAFQSVLKELDGKVDKIVSAGDLVGYYPHPNEVIELFREHEIKTILGNHDVATILNDTSWFNYYAVKAIEYTQESITEENMRFLRSLRRRESMRISSYIIAIIHGSPRNDDEYIYEEMVGESFLRDTGSDILILGHTHVPFIRRFSNGIIINPGSVGQPRDGNPKASYAVLDFDTMSAEIVRVEYDIDATRRAVMEAGLPLPLGERLVLGL